MQSVTRGIGPICIHNMGDHDMPDSERPYDVFIDDVPIVDGFVFRREEELKVATNVPHLVTYHSPDGFEWGYGGSGPADLALNILEAVLQQEGHTGPREELRGGESCYWVAWRLYQEFKAEFIATIPKNGGHLSYTRVTEWMKKHVPALNFKLSIDGTITADAGNGG